MIFFYLQCR